MICRRCDIKRHTDDLQVHEQRQQKSLESAMIAASHP
jgi:hypothetical protein